ncbi:MAG: tRNA pseudouridine(55) synthase TruB [Bacillota bacterium]
MEGIVNVLKPPGMTSSNVVSDLRRIFGQKRIGHAGTLDPGAAGVLPICIGRATRLFDYLVDKEKTYIAELCVGAKTDTQDSYGKVTGWSKRSVSEKELLCVLPEFTGEILQTVPMYSAAKIGGEALYKLARSGREAERAPRRVTVRELVLIDAPGSNRFLLRVRCSKGTYVRTLCEDIGTRLNACAHLSFLLRAESGAFSQQNAYSIAELERLKSEDALESAMTGMEEALMHLPALELDPADAAQKKLLVNGCALPAPETYRREFEGAALRVYCGEFLGIARIDGGVLKMSLLLSEGER